MTVEGFVEPGFEAVQREFERNFTERGEIGAAFAVYHHGRPVVDLWGGVTDPANDTPWAHDTITVYDSASKAIPLILAHMLIEDGSLKLDEPVATYWPAFAPAGKASITVRQLLSHQAGLPAIDLWLTLDAIEAGEPIVQALEAHAPLWEPGTAHGYHAVTLGFLLGELLRRVSGRTTAQLIRDRLADPLGIDLWLGLPTDQQHRLAATVRQHQVGSGAGFDTVTDNEAWDAFNAEMMQVFIDPLPRTPAVFEQDLTMTQRVFGLFDFPLDYDTHPRVRSAQRPASNCYGTARGLARLFASLVGTVDGTRLWSPDRVDDASTVEASGADAVLKIPAAWSTGFHVRGGTFYDTILAVGDRMFGHGGANGTTALADPGDSRHLLTLQTDERQVLPLLMVDWAPTDGSVRPTVKEVRTALPGDAHLTEFRLVALDVETGRQVAARHNRLQAVRMNDTPFSTQLTWWSADSTTAYVVDVARGEREARVVAVDIATGHRDVVFTETADSYLDLGLNVHKPSAIAPLPDTDEVLWLSERTGWAHLPLRPPDRHLHHRGDERGVGPRDPARRRGTP